MSDHFTSFAGDDRVRTSRGKKVGFDLHSDVESDSSRHDDSESRYSDIERGVSRRKAARKHQQKAQSSERKQHKQPLRGGIIGAHYNRESVQSFSCDSYAESSESSEHTHSDQSQSLSPSFLQDSRLAPKDFRAMQESAQSCFYDSFGEASEASAHLQSNQSQSMDPSVLQDDQLDPTDLRRMQESTQSFFYDSFGEGSESSADTHSDQSQSMSPPFLQDDQLAPRDFRTRHESAFSASSPKRGDQGDENSDRAVAYFESPTKTPRSAPSVQSGPRLYSENSDRAICSQSSDPAATQCSRVMHENDETASATSSSDESFEAVSIRGYDVDAETIHDSNEWDMQETHIKAQIEAAREELRNRYQQKQTRGLDEVPLQLHSEGTAASEHNTQLEHVMAQLEAARQELQAATEEMRDSSFKNKEPRIETLETELKSLEVPAESQNRDTSVGTKLEEEVLGDERSPTVETANTRKSELQHKVDALEEEKRKLYEDIRLLDEANKTLKNEMVAFPSPDGAPKSPTPGHLQDDDDDSSTSSTASSCVLFSPGGGLRAQILRQARDGVDARGLKSHQALDPDEADSADIASIGRSHMLFSPPRGPREKIRILKQTRDPSDHQRRTNPQALDPEEEVKVFEVLSPMPIQEFNNTIQSERSSGQAEVLDNDAATVDTTNTRKSELYHKVDALEDEKRELYERVQLLEEAKSTWLTSSSNQSVSSRRSAGPLHQGMINSEAFKVKRSKSTSDRPASSLNKTRAKNENQLTKVNERMALESTIRPIDVRAETRAEKNIERDSCQKIPMKDPRWSSQDEPSPSPTRGVQMSKSTSPGVSLAPQRKASLRPDPDRQVHRPHSTDRMVPPASPTERPKRRPRPPKNLPQNQMGEYSSSSPDSPFELEGVLGSHQYFDVVVWEDASIGGTSAMTESVYDYESPVKSKRDDPRWTANRDRYDSPQQSMQVARRTPSIVGNQTKKTKPKKDSRWDSQHEPDPSPVRGVHRRKSASAGGSLEPRRPAPERQVRRAHSADRLVPPSSPAVHTRDFAPREKTKAKTKTKTKTKRRPHPSKPPSKNQSAKHITYSGDDASIDASAAMTGSVIIPPVKSRHSSKASPNKLSLNSTDDDPRWTANRAPEVPQQPTAVIQPAKSASERGRRSLLPDPIRNMFRAKSSEQMPKMPKPLRAKSRPTSERDHINNNNNNSLQHPETSVPKGRPRAKSVDEMPRMPKPLRAKSTKPVSERDRSNSTHNSTRNSNSNSNSNSVQPNPPVRKLKRAKSSDAMTKHKPPPLVQPDHPPIRKLKRAKSSDAMTKRKPPRLLDDKPDNVPVRKVSRSKSSDHVVVPPVPRTLAPSSSSSKPGVKGKSSSKKSKGSSKQHSKSSSPSSSQVLVESKPKSKLTSKSKLEPLDEPNKMLPPTRSHSSVMKLLSMSKLANEAA